MRHPLPDDLAWIDDILDDWPCTLRWDIKGYTPSAPSLAGRLWDGVVTQRVVTGDGGQPSGLFQLVDLNLLDRTARIEAIARTAADVAEGWKDFTAAVSDDFPLRFTHVLAVADGFDVAEVEPTAREAGRLRGAHFRGCGRYEDIVIYEIPAARTATEVGADDIGPSAR